MRARLAAKAAPTIQSYESLKDAARPFDLTDERREKEIGVAASRHKSCIKSIELAFPVQRDEPHSVNCLSAIKSNKNGRNKPTQKKRA